MTTLRVTPPADEEGVDVDGVEEAKGADVSVCGHFGQSWASLHLMIAASMAHITGKNELITSLRIPINIYEGYDEVKRKINSESLKKG